MPQEGIPGAHVWWRKSAFDLARARRRKRVRPGRWLNDPAAAFRIRLATRRLSPAARARWNRRAEGAAADPLLSAVDPHQWRAAACFEDRAMVTAEAGFGKTRTMVARAGYAAGGLGAPPEAIAFITVQLSPMGEDDGLRRRRIAGWIWEEIDRDPGARRRRRTAPECAHGRGEGRRTG